jgi:ArsR family transcriptional regulator, arsenate/arsenite/antimonite-responsive transcriptional repressor / arsenate reductase (thioredoxin)
MSSRDRAAVFAALGDEHRMRIVDELLLTDLTPAALGSRVGQPSNLLAHHLAVLEEAGLIRRTPSEGDGRRRYVALVVDALPFDPELPRVSARSVLFVCRQNSARSQMAAALLGRRSDCAVQSAGLAPAAAIHPRAIEVAGEAGITLTGRPRGYPEVTSPDLVISVCDVAAEDEIPFAGASRLHWSIPDPVRRGRLGDFRAARREIERRVDLLTRAINRPGDPR